MPFMFGVPEDDPIKQILAFFSYYFVFKIQHFWALFRQFLTCLETGRDQIGEAHNCTESE